MANRSAALPLLKHDSCFVRSGIVTQAWALKVSDVPGATHNRIGSNRYRHRSAGAGVGSPGRDAGSGQTKRSRELVFLHRGPRVRIRLPPADSQSLSRSRFSRSRTPLFRASLGSWLGDRVSPDLPALTPERGSSTVSGNSARRYKIQTSVTPGLQSASSETCATSCYSLW